MSKLTESIQWNNLLNHSKEIKKTHLRDLFNDDNRAKALSIVNDNLNLYVDYSKNNIDSETMKLLIDLAEHQDVQSAIKAMFMGERVNMTENRPALHTALRNRSNEPVIVDGMDIMPQINSVLLRMKHFSEKLRNGILVGATGEKIKSIVNIGIGGSDLGPKMVYEALKYYADGPEVLFTSNVDGADIYEILKKLNPATTLFIVASKTFTTQETLANAATAKDWLTSSLGVDAVKNHFVALSTNRSEVELFGINPENMFQFWDFVGGRYSLWSAIGLSIACSIGFDNFEDLLSGAHEMDLHFLNTPYENNIPVTLALLGIWNVNFMGHETQAILPYSYYLSKLPSYLQQAEMESNGKTVDVDGNKVDYQTCPVIWGESGTNGQHSFYQLIHQGSSVVPADFIGFINPINKIGDHHEKLMANFFAQTRALAFGMNLDDVSTNLKQEGLTDEEVKRLAPCKVFEGNRPTNTIMFDQLTPRTLGRLIAMYEHKIFVQGVIWNINSFDQMGVQLGKTLAEEILPGVYDNLNNPYDSSSEALLTEFHRKKL